MHTWYDGREVISCGPLLLLPTWLHIQVRADGPVNFPVLLLKSLDILPNQNQNVTVDRTPLIVGHKAQLLQHFFLDANGHTFNCHKITSIDSIEIIL